VTDAVRLEGVSKRYGSIVALREVDLLVPEGAFLSVFGPNGAGKTTLLAVLATIARPTEGRVAVFGHDTLADGALVRSQVGLVSHDSFAYDNLTALENLLFYGRLYGIGDAGERSHDMLDSLGLYGRRNDLVCHFSQGMRQRLAIARALLHDPRLLLLDEPFSGLDIHAASTLSELLASFYSERRTVVMATHRLEEGLSLSDRLAILASGRLVFERPTAGLSADALQEIYLRHVGITNVFQEERGSRRRP
jgi:heme exporter protein A